MVQVRKRTDIDRRYRREWVIDHHAAPFSYRAVSYRIRPAYWKSGDNRHPEHQPARALTRCGRYLMTWSAAATTCAGMVGPIICAVLRLATISNLVGVCTGMSAGFSPLRIRSM